jgi:hypothetical protein
MEPEGSLPHSQELSTCSYPELDQFSPHRPNLSLKDPFQYCPPTYVLVFHVISCTLSFPPITYTHFSFPTIRATCPAHLILFDLIILIILDEEYKSRSSSLCSFLHPPVTSSLFGPNSVLSTLMSNTLSLCSSLSVRPGSAPVQNHRQNYSLVYSHF